MSMSSLLSIFLVPFFFHAAVGKPGFVEFPRFLLSLPQISDYHHLKFSISKSITIYF